MVLENCVRLPQFPGSPFPSPPLLLLEEVPRTGLTARVSGVINDTV